MKYCTQCGAETVSGAQFCSGCGAPLAGESATPTVQAHPAQAYPASPPGQAAPALAGYPPAGYMAPGQASARYMAPGYPPAGYGPRSTSGSGVPILGWITVVLLALQLYFLRYASDEYDALRQDRFFFRHSGLDLATFFAFETLFVVAVVLAVVATARSRRGARGWWVATLGASIAANVLQMFGGVRDFYSGYVWTKFRFQFGLISLSHYQQWISLGGLIALVLTIVLVIVAGGRTRTYGPNPQALTGPPMGYNRS